MEKLYFFNLDRGNEGFLIITKDPIYALKNGYFEWSKSDMVYEQNRTEFFTSKEEAKKFILDWDEKRYGKRKEKLVLQIFLNKNH